MIASDALTLPRVRHAFFTREGGVSEGVYASLNCGFGSGDAAARVAENRRRAMARLGLGADSLNTIYQVHGTEVAVVERPFAPGTAPRADAQVTRMAGVALGILTADCAPVLFADPEAGVVGAAHAGWRGALAGVVEATIFAMEGLGATRAHISAAIGPTIGRASYEVGPEFREAFLAADTPNASFFDPGRGDRFQFDLPAYVESRLAAAGLAAFERIDADTCAAPDRFFSYRRVTLEGGGDYGRALAAVAIES
jgi:purine-nucleoside/S-methyl-5'-thioadenosine phosphorylase / adenosine deaminase